MIALAEGADAERAATIGVFHDLAETRTGDIEYVGRHYVTAVGDDVITNDQVRDMPGVLAEALLGIVRQAQDDGSPEAACARDADKLECLLQAREYQRQGHADVQQWIDNNGAAVRTETGKALARAALDADPAAWWREVAAIHARTTERAGASATRSGTIGLWRLDTTKPRPWPSECCPRRRPSVRAGVDRRGAEAFPRRAEARLRRALGENPRVGAGKRRCGLRSRARPPARDRPRRIATDAHPERPVRRRLATLCCEQ
jgi:putative hydrolase of HD superfamily